MQLHDYRRAIDEYLSASCIEPSYREPYIGLAKAYMAVNRHSDAIQALKLAIKNTYRHYSWLERDASWTYEIYDLLCLAYYYNGQKLESLGCAYKALSMLPSDERLKSNVQLVLDGMAETDYVH